MQFCREDRNDFSSLKNSKYTHYWQPFPLHVQFELKHWISFTKLTSNFNTTEVSACASRKHRSNKKEKEKKKRVLETLLSCSFALVNSRVVKKATRLLFSRGSLTLRLIYTITQTVTYRYFSLLSGGALLTSKHPLKDCMYHREALNVTAGLMRVLLLQCTMF